MCAALYLDSAIAQFTENPFTRNWPESSAVDALFRYSVRRFLDICQGDPRSWLTRGDLCALLGTVLHEELPSHGLPAHAVHHGFPYTSMADAAKRTHSPSILDLVLVLPQTIHWDEDNKSQAAIVAAAAVRLGHGPINEVREDLKKLAALRDSAPDLLCYLVVMGYHDDQDTIQAVAVAAEEYKIPYLGANCSGSVEPARQEKLL